MQFDRGAVAEFGNSRGACGRVLDATVSASWFGPAVASGTQPQAPATRSPSVKTMFSTKQSSFKTPNSVIHGGTGVPPVL